MFVFDNSTTDEKLKTLCLEAGAELFSLGKNTGIGFAQNRGIERAIAAGADAILLMDQDSEPRSDMVPLLVEALVQNPKAAATGASSIDLRTGRRSYFEFDTGGWPGRWLPVGETPGQTVEAAYLIASGSLVRAQTLKELGLMREDWFIDHIDTEWSLRARAAGWLMLGVADAQLGHRLGDKVTKVWFGRARQVPHHSPQRNYYMFRNALLLLQEKFVPKHWRRYHLTRLAQLFFFFLALAPQRTLRLRLIVKGVADGLRGRTGPML